jgi:acyl-coenzyme A synthetase/AMP-(fatty) acid ligase
MWLELANAVKHWGRYTADRDAIITESDKISYYELDAAADALVCRLEAVPISSSIRIALATATKPEFLIALIACRRLGASPVILNPYLSSEYLQQTIRDTGPNALIVDKYLAGNEVLASYLEELPSVILEDTTRRGDARPSLRPHKVEDATLTDEWGVLFSSGSTGVPKAIVHNRLSMTSEILAWCLELELRRSSRFFIGRPLFYTGGLVLAAACLLVGATTVFLSGQDDDESDALWPFYQKVCQEANVAWAFFIPTQLRQFCRAMKEGSLRRDAGATAILTMGEPITGKEKLEARQLLGSKLVESWGNSEGLGTITSVEDLDERPGSSGRPFLTEQIFVVDQDLQSCPPEVVGRIAGPEQTMFTEYAGRDEATKRIKRDALVLSDDLGYLDEDGYLYVLGRDEQVIITEEHTIVIPTLETELLAEGFAKELAILPLQHEEKSSFHVFIVPSESGTSSAALQSACQEALSIPINIHGITVLRGIPRLPSGKVDRPRLREMLGAA